MLPSIYHRLGSNKLGKIKKKKKTPTNSFSQPDGCVGVSDGVLSVFLSWLAASSISACAGRPLRPSCKGDLGSVYPSSGEGPRGSALRGPSPQTASLLVGSSFLEGQAAWLQNTETYSLTVLEARSPKPGCRPGRAPLRCPPGLSRLPGAAAKPRCPLVCTCVAPISAPASYGLRPRASVFTVSSPVS